VELTLHLLDETHDPVIPIEKGDGVDLGEIPDTGVTLLPDPDTQLTGKRRPEAINASPISHSVKRGRERSTRMEGLRRNQLRRGAKVRARHGILANTEEDGGEEGEGMDSDPSGIYGES